MLVYHTHVAVEYIKKRLPMLEYLDIGSNNIGDEGLRHITESLESSNSMLTELHIQKCDISTNGMHNGYLHTYKTLVKFMHMYIVGDDK